MLDRQKLGKKSRKKGTTSQYKSKQYILKHPEKYGILVEKVLSSGGLYSERVHGMINSSFPTPHKDLFTKWDIITMPEVKNMLIYLVQVKSNKVDTQLILELEKWFVPVYVKKEIHIWKDKAILPEIIEL